MNSMSSVSHSERIGGRRRKPDIANHPGLSSRPRSGSRGNYSHWAAEENEAHRDVVRGLRSHS